MNTIALLFLPTLLTSAYGAVGQYEILPDTESYFALEITKTGLMAGKKHRFEFSGYHGSLSYDSERPSNSSLRLIIESKSALCQDTWVRAKDRDKIQSYALNEMLDSGQYPEIVFQSTAVEPKTEGQFRVQGQLTIRKQTKPVTIQVKLDGTHSPLLRFAGQADVRLTDYSLKPPTAALGAIGTKDEMAVLFQLTAKPVK